MTSLCDLIIVDVVHAYKNLVKEKEALETSIKVLTAAGAQNAKRQPGKTHKKQATVSDNNPSSKEGDGHHIEEYDQVKSHPQETVQGTQLNVEDHPLAVKEQESEDGEPQNVIINH